MKVVRRKNESFEDLLARFKAGCRREGIKGTILKKEYYISKGEKERMRRKEAIQEAKKNNKKPVREFDDKRQAVRNPKQIKPITQTKQKLQESTKPKADVKASANNKPNKPTAKGNKPNTANNKPRSNKTNGKAGKSA